MDTYLDGSPAVNALSRGEFEVSFWAGVPECDYQILT